MFTLYQLHPRYPVYYLYTQNDNTPKVIYIQPSKIAKNGAKGYANNIKDCIKKSRIRETKHLATDADSSTNAIGGWTKAKSAKKTFILRGDFRQLPNNNCQMLDHFFPLLFPKDSGSLKKFDIRLSEVGAKRALKKPENQRRLIKMKKKNFFLCGDLRQFSNKNIHI